MKLIGTLQGVCLIKFSHEEVAPTSGIQLSKVQGLIQSFGARPAPALLVKPPVPGDFPTINFGGGEFNDGQMIHAIAQIQFAGNGILVTAQNTDAAEKILNNLVERLDSEQNFRLKDSAPKRFLVSALVVKFDRSFEEYIAPLKAIRDIIQTSMQRDSGIFAKRLSFGPEDESHLFVSLETIEAAEFVLERRAGTKFSDNRYFSIAPLGTDHHLRTLQLIEDAVPTTK